MERQKYPGGYCSFEVLIEIDHNLLKLRLNRLSCEMKRDGASLKISEKYAETKITKFFVEFKTSQNWL